MSTPIFAIRDLRADVAHYGGGGYAYATLDGAEIHRGLAATRGRNASENLFVDDADASPT